MASYHCKVKIISRSSGRTAVASSAYRAGEKLVNLHDLDKKQRTHDYSQRSGVLYKKILLPEIADIKLNDRATLWNTIEQLEGNNKSAQVAKEVELALPFELDLDETVELLEQFIKDNFISKNMIADYAIHEPHFYKDEDGKFLLDENGEKMHNKNMHAHIMLTMRPLDNTGNFQTVKSRGVYIYETDPVKWTPILDKQGNQMIDENSELLWEKRKPLVDKKTGKQKLRDGNRKVWERKTEVAAGWDFDKNEPIWKTPTMKERDSELAQIRKSWADVQNEALKKKGLDVRVDHRSHKDMQADGVMIVGILPTINIGRESFRKERDGYYLNELDKKNKVNKQFETLEGEYNREVKKHNNEIFYLHDSIKVCDKNLEIIENNIKENAGILSKAKEQLSIFVENLKKKYAALSIFKIGDIIRMPKHEDADISKKLFQLKEDRENHYNANVVGYENRLYRKGDIIKDVSIDKYDILKYGGGVVPMSELIKPKVQEQTMAQAPFVIPEPEQIPEGMVIVYGEGVKPPSQEQTAAAPPPAMPEPERHEAPEPSNIPKKPLIRDTIAILEKILHEIQKDFNSRDYIREKIIEEKNTFTSIAKSNLGMKNVNLNVLKNKHKAIKNNIQDKIDKFKEADPTLEFPDKPTYDDIKLLIKDRIAGLNLIKIWDEPEKLIGKLIADETMTATIINVKDDMVYYTSNNEEYSIELSTISRMFNRKNIFEPVDLKPIKIHINEISDKLIDRVRQRKDSKGRSVDFDTALTKLDTARIVAALKKVPPLERENAYKEILAYNPIVRASEHETNIPNQIYSIRNKIKRDLQAEFPEIAKSVSLDYIFLFFFYIHTTLLLIPSTLYLL